MPLNNMKDSQPPTQNQETPARRPSIFLYLAWFLLIWLLLLYFMQSGLSSGRAVLSYTEFRNQVDKGNVKEITITGNTITGTFNEDYIEETGPGGPKKQYTQFSTEKPPIEDPSLLSLLNSRNVIINAEPEKQNWLPYLLINILPWVLILGYFFYIGSRMQNQVRGQMGGEGIFGGGTSRAKRYLKSSNGVRFRDIAGLEGAKQDLMEIIEYLKKPQRFSQLGAQIPKGFLLIGPPGCGKTLLAKATAQEIGIPFFSISGSEFIEMFVGVGAQRVRDMFATAKKEAPAIVFIDEIDSIGRSRGLRMEGGHGEFEQTLNQVLSEMDGFDSSDYVVVMAATNRPDVLDPALTRPGRFDRQIVVGYPQKKARLQILQIHTRHVPLDADVDLQNLAARTVGFSGAHLKNLVNEAALLAGRKNKDKVFIEDFEQARDKILLGEKTEEMMDDREKKMVAYHEAGHALVAEFSEEADPLQKVTIIPRGMSLGQTEQVPETDRQNMTKGYLQALITIRLGGRAAEKLAFDTLSSGSSSDLKQATNIARKMVCQLGMSEKLGPMAFYQSDENAFIPDIMQSKDFSEHMAELIDEEVQGILLEGERYALALLKENRVKLDALAAALFEHETLDRQEVEKILK